MRFPEALQRVTARSLLWMPHRESKRRPWQMFIWRSIMTWMLCRSSIRSTLPSAEPERVINEIEDVIGIEAQDAPQISAKTGLNVEEVLEQIVEKVPAPTGDPNAPLQALIFDSVYDSYKGVIVFCRIKEGKISKGTSVRMMATGAVEDDCGSRLFRSRTVYSV